ncbi:thiamine-phosphate kinase [Thiomicrorhabdus sp.]|uniref:thiamine-phosphate kinase n=1 Tax=Thiomicrorhabdus sp. TaxID=2039724 RepID=UPI0029C8ADA6|nr:thiamine-phosphate kinase [Thiomicrorhabdus sp.]
MAKEFDLIDDFFVPLGEGGRQSEGEGQIGIGDDGAVISVPSGHQAVVVTDTLVCGVHFPPETSAFDIGWKALAVNLSDLAAMGAQPAFYSLALTLPNYDAEWLRLFALGLKASAEACFGKSIPLIGGDTTKGPLCITVSAQGWVADGQAVMRHTAKNGDHLFVSGFLGDAALGLKLAMPKFWGKIPVVSFVPEEEAYLLTALNRPEAGVAYAEILREFAHAAIDISDGFLADLGHILRRSSKQLGTDLQACIDLAALPTSKAMQRYLALTSDWTALLNGGDDYRLCFTVSADRVAALKEEAQRRGLPVFEVGVVRNRSQGAPRFELVRDRLDGGLLAEDFSVEGFQHF